MFPYMEIGINIEERGNGNNQYTQHIVIAKQKALCILRFSSKHYASREVYHTQVRALCGRQGSNKLEYLRAFIRAQFYRFSGEIIPVNTTTIRYWGNKQTYANRIENLNFWSSNITGFFRSSF